MAFKFLVFAAFVAIAQAGIYGETYSAPLTYAAPAVAKVAYSEAPAVSYSSVSAPVAYAKYAAPLTYAAPAVAKVAYSQAPAVSYSSVSAPVAYAKYAAPLSYAAPAVAKVAYSQAPAVSYSSVSAPIAYAKYAAAPVSYAAAPAYKVAAPVAYAAPAYKVAAPVAYAAPVAKAVYAEPSAPANYDFGYSVNDPHTGDNKNQQESRHGDVVHGSYSLVESDGSRRIVEYTADAHNGFNAVVHKEPGHVAVKTVAPVAYAAPAYKVAAPVAYAQPAYKVAAAPVAYAAPSYYH